MDAGKEPSFLERLGHTLALTAAFGALICGPIGGLGGAAFAGFKILFAYSTAPTIGGIFAAVGVSAVSLFVGCAIGAIALEATAPHQGLGLFAFRSNRLQGILRKEFPNWQVTVTKKGQELSVRQTYAKDDDKNDFFEVCAKTITGNYMAARGETESRFNAAIGAHSDFDINVEQLSHSEIDRDKKDFAEMFVGRAQELYQKYNSVASRPVNNRHVSTRQSSSDQPRF